MEYNAWISNLKSRGYNTTGLSGNEANFADYGNALSSEIKAKIAQNGKSDADKQLQAYVASLFGGKSNMQASELMRIAKAKGLKVSTSYVKTTYIMDEKNSASPGKGTKRVRTGSVAVYEITDSKGGKLVIADANGNAAIEMEEVFMNEILSGVTSDISAGAAGGADNSAKIEELKAQNEELKQKLDDLQKQYEQEVADAEKAIQEEQEAIQKETEAIISAWEAKIENDPSKVYDMESELQGVLSVRNANIARYESAINNNATMAQMQNVITEALNSETELTKMDGYKAQQVPGTMTSAEKYNQMMQENAKEAAGLTATATKAALSSSIDVSAAKSSTTDKNIDAKRQYETQQDEKAAEDKKKKEEEKAAA